jgi:bacillolysin
LRTRARAAGLAACALVSIITLAAAGTAGTAPSWVGASTAARPGTGLGAAPAGGARSARQPVARRTTSPPKGALPAGQALRELRARGSSLTVDRAGVVRSVTAAAGQVLAGSPDSFVTRYAAAFGLTSSQTLVRTTTTALPGGSAVTRYQQRAGGLPVLGGEVVVTTDPAGRVRGTVTETTVLSPETTSTKVAPGTAAATAVKAIASRYGLDAVAGARPDPSLWLFDPALLGAPGGGQLRPTYRVSMVDAAGAEFATVLVDALDGTVKLAASERQSAQRRIVCDLANVRVNLSALANYACNEYTALGRKTTTRHEGGPVSTVADVNSAYDRLGGAYAFFRTSFGRDSYDGHGGQIRATVRICSSSSTTACPYDNAFWDGYQFSFGQGWAADDVVAHEFTHAVTEHASNLFYWYQAGAINEALSDIFGQLIDLTTPADDAGATRWLLGENLPVGAIRSMANPNAYGQPAYLGDPYWYWGSADNGGVHYNSGPANRAAYLIADGLDGSGSTGIGLAKSAQLWYRVLHMLPSGANYQELGLTLKAACRELIGHLGFTPADCTGIIEPAISMTAMYGSGETPVYSEPEAMICDGSFQTPQDLFSDDMEHGPGQWKFSNTYYWELIPNAVIDYSYAAHGRGSINGWTAPGDTGHGTWMELAQPVALPTGKPLYLHFNWSLLKNGSGSVDLFINNGSGWQPLSAPADGRFSGNRLISATSGYGASRIDLAAYAGTSVKLMFKVNSPTNTLVDWYLDDLRLYTCDPAKSGVPPNAYGYRSGTDLVLNWDRGYIGKAPSGLPMDFSYEFGYSPPIAGAPTTFTPTGNNGPWSVTVPGADPGVDYTVTIAVRTADGALGPPAVVEIPAGLTPVCATSVPGPLVLPVLRKPALVPEGQCSPAPIPRR